MSTDTNTSMDDSQPSRPEASNRDYVVGYGKPPKEHCFRKGKSGNPKGRPKKEAKPFLTLANDVLDEEIQVKMGGSIVFMSKREHLVRVSYDRVTKGDHTAFATWLRQARQAGMLKRPPGAQRGGVVLHGKLISPEEWAAKYEKRIDASDNLSEV